MIAVFFIHLTVLLSVLSVIWKLSVRPKRRFPPGPKGLPLIGNLYDVPNRDDWIVYKEMSVKYKSDIIYLNMFGTPVIILNSLEMAQDIFEARSVVYSERPRCTMLNELMGFSWHFGLMPYGEFWRKHRALFRKHFQSSALTFHNDAVSDATHTLLVRLLADPRPFLSHLRHMAGMIILRTAYGIKVQPENDPYIRMSEKALQGLAKAGNPGAYFVDTIPWLKYVPEWFPGAGFQKEAKEWRQYVTSMPRATLDFVKRSMANGTAVPSIASKNLQEMEDQKSWSAEKEQILANVLSSMYAAGADTTVSALGTFILAMAENPEVQKKGQTAVDSVVGTDHLPTFADQQLIPYVDAIMKEVLRWKPVTPLAAPHVASCEDVYLGYNIPAGSVVIGNAWAMLHDASVYGPDTHLFKPERFMKDECPNPEVPHPDAVFGFGRRKCPGQDMAQSSIWLTIASILSVFDIEKVIDEDGAVIEPACIYSSGLLCYPSHFPCVIKPRSPRAAELIRHTQVEV